MPNSTQRTTFDIVPWNSSFNTNIAIIDDQHQQLVSLINDLAHEYVYGGQAGEAERILDALIDYAAYHFETEENLWEKALDHGDFLDDHLKTHRGFANKVNEIRTRLKADNSRALIDELLSFLTSWLAHHILYEDKLFSLVFLQLEKGIDFETARQNAEKDMSGRTSHLIRSVLSMYKDLSSRTLALERESHSRSIAEQALQDQEHRWTSVLGASTDCLWDWDISNIDRSFNNLLIIEDHFSQPGFSIHPEDWPSLKHHVIHHIEGHIQVFEHQYRLLSNDGHGNERWIQTRGKVIEFNDNNQPLRMVGTQTDITERKTNEITLKRERDMRTIASEFAAEFMGAATADFDSAINHALKRSGEYMKADRTYVFLLTSNGERLNNTHEWCAAGVSPEIDNLQGIPADTLPWWWSQFKDVGYVLVPRVSEMPLEARNEHEILDAQGIQSVCVFPLYIGQKLIGFLGNDAVFEERHWGPEVIEFLSLLSNLLGISLGHRNLHHKRAEALSQLERAEKQAHLGHWQVDYTNMTSLWSKEMYEIFECDSNTFVPNLESYLELVHPDDRAPLFRAYEDAKINHNDIHLEHRTLLKNKVVKHLEIRGRLITSPDGQLTSSEGTVQDVTEKVEQRELLRKLAYEDPLTNLPNQRAIEEVIETEMKYCDSQSNRLVLALLDLDNFREINELQGATFGDALLKALAQRMKTLLNDTATVSRIGGDEFIVLFSRLPLDDGYFQKLNRLLSMINEPFTINNITVALSASIGVTEYPQPIQLSGDQLQRQAQQALFQAKMMGKGIYQKYDVSLEQDNRANSIKLEQIKEALRANEFVLYYQPKVSMKTGIVFGAEALIRWQKPNGDLVPPGDFLPALNNHPLEVELGDWVIRTALQQMRQWNDQGFNIQVSVNVSSLQLFDESFVEKLDKDLQDFPEISPSMLQLEVLESSMLNDLEMVSNIMQRSRELGVSFALDDFGTGYSSLAYLKHLPASVLKVDQSFVREMMENTNDLSIISGVIGMANAFSMDVIAEGVETVDQGDLLLKLGCEQGQGYGIARPMPAEDLSNWITQWQAPESWIGQQAIEYGNLSLLYAEVEHRCWVKQLEDWLLDKGSTIPILDHTQCKVGKWIANPNQHRLKKHPRFSFIEDVHRDLHTLGMKAAALHAKDKKVQALEIMDQIKQQRDLYIREMKSLLS